MEYPELKSLSMDFWNVEALPCVAMMVTLTPCMANTLAVSIIGFIWPADGNGRKTT